MESPFNNFIADGFVVHNSGKTSCAARFARPLILLTETQAIPVIRELNPRAAIKQIRSPQDLLEARQILRAPNLVENHDAVVLDSLTDCQRILKDFYTSQQQKRQDLTDMDTWGRIIDATARLARELRDVPVHVLCICLDSEVAVEGEGITHRPAVSGKTLPNVLGQFFNAVGYISRQVKSKGMRREIMFEGSDRYQTKKLTGLDDIEAPEPLLWLHKRFGIDLPADVQKRVSDWKACADEAATHNVTKLKTTKPIKSGTVDPFA
jgi:hypothetical protein